jgi:hypothetical protein
MIQIWQYFNHHTNPFVALIKKKGGAKRKTKHLPFVSKFRDPTLCKISNNSVNKGRNEVQIRICRYNTVCSSLLLPQQE